VRFSATIAIATLGLATLFGSVAGASSAVSGKTFTQCIKKHDRHAKVTQYRTGLHRVTFANRKEARLFFYRTAIAAERVWVMSLVGERHGSTIIDWYTQPTRAGKNLILSCI
jgi:hypothetical protein